MKILVGTIILCSFSILSYALEDFQLHANVNKYYKFFKHPQLWHQAVDTCKREGSTLAMPRNAAEVSALNSIFKNYPPSILRGALYPDYILLGFHDIFQEGEYIALNGESIQYYFHTWGGGQPDNSNNEDCGSMHRSERINDFPCGIAAVFICEKNGPKTANEISDCGTTDLAYKHVDDLKMCYKLHLNPRPWSVARAICEAEGSQLAIIKNKAEETFLVSMFNHPDNRIHHVVHKDYALLGFHDMYEENHFITVNDKDLYDTGYVNWNPGQPDNAGGNENCGSMHSIGGINDFPCSVPAVFFCERPAVSFKLDVRFGDQ